MIAIPLSIERVDAPSTEWDAFVRKSAGWTHFHLSGWKSVIERVFGHECLYLAARAADGDLAGVLPLVRVKSRVFGHYLVSMPFLNYGGPLGTPEAVRALTAQAVEAAARPVKLLELRSKVPLDVDLAASHRKVTVLLDLPAEDPEVLWKGLKSKVRSQVRRPQKEGVSVRFGLDQVGPFYRIFAHHMRDLGTPVQSATLFSTIAETFPEDVWFGCAYLGEEAIAAGCGFRWNGEFEMTWASALIEYKRVAANMLLYWSFMERAVHDGVETFNFGRCTPGGATHRFKLQWGARDESLWWYQHAPGGPASTPSPDDGAYSWGPRLWRRLPVSVASALGPHIVRYIP